MLRVIIPEFIEFIEFIELIYVNGGEPRIYTKYISVDLSTQCRAEYNITESCQTTLEEFRRSNVQNTVQRRQSTHFLGSLQRRVIYTQRYRITSAKAARYLTLSISKLRLETSESLLAGPVCLWPYMLHRFPYMSVKRRVSAFRVLKF
jgi:hypothetical protein